MKKDKKITFYYKGIMAEYYCKLRLWFSGHKILGRRIKTPLGEIDLLTTKGCEIYVIEVKYRAASLDEAKFAMLKSKERIFGGYKWLISGNGSFKFDHSREDPALMLQSVRFCYFAMSGLRSEFGEFDF